MGGSVGGRECGREGGRRGEVGARVQRLGRARGECMSLLNGSSSRSCSSPAIKLCLVCKTHRADKGERELLITNGDGKHLYTWAAGSLDPRPFWQCALGRVWRITLTEVS